MVLASSVDWLILMTMVSRVDVPPALLAQDLKLLWWCTPAIGAKCVRSFWFGWRLGVVAEKRLGHGEAEFQDGGGVCVWSVFTWSEWHAKFRFQPTGTVPPHEHVRHSGGCARLDVAGNSDEGKLEASAPIFCCPTSSFRPTSTTDATRAVPPSAPQEGMEADRPSWHARRRWRVLSLGQFVTPVFTVFRKSEMIEGTLNAGM